MRNHPLSFSSVASVLGVAFVFGLTGCSANFGDVANTSSQTAVHIKGVVHGGQQSLNGAHIYMYAASTGGYGGNGITFAAIASMIVPDLIRGRKNSDARIFRFERGSK